MIIYDVPRGSGKTMFLIKLSAETKRRIITCNEMEAKRIEKIAKELNLDILKPLSWRDISSLSDFSCKKEHYLIDEYDVIVKTMLQNHLSGIIDVATTTRNDSCVVVTDSDVFRK